MKGRMVHIPAELIPSVQRMHNRALGEVPTGGRVLWVSAGNIQTVLEMKAEFKRKRRQQIQSAIAEVA